MSEPMDPRPPEDPAFSAPPPAGGSAQPAGNPWEQREQLGFGQAFVENVKLFVLNPGEAYARTLRKGDFAGPLIFAVLIGWIGAVLRQIWGLLFNASLMKMMPPEFQEQMGSGLMMGGAGFIVSLILYPILAVIFLFIWAGILHLCLMLVGGTGQSDAGFEGTFRSVSYANVASLGYLIPVVGGLIFLGWSIVLNVIGLSSLHRTTQGKALFAVLLPLILCCLCAILAIALGVGGMMGMMDQMQ